MKMCRDSVLISFTVTSRRASSTQWRRGSGGTPSFWPVRWTSGRMPALWRGSPMDWPLTTPCRHFTSSCPPGCPQQWNTVQTRSDIMQLLIIFIQYCYVHKLNTNMFWKGAHGSTANIHCKWLFTKKIALIIISYKMEWKTGERHLLG